MPYTAMAQIEKGDIQKTESQPIGNNDNSADRNGVYINIRPTRDFLTDARQKLEANEISLDLEFKVAIAASLGLGKDSKTIILLHPKVVQDQMGLNNDPMMEKLALDAILAVGDSGWFGFLYQSDVRNVVITLEQNNAEFIANVQADQPDEVAARRTAGGLSGLLKIAVPTMKPEEKEFLSRVNLGSEGKFFNINLNVPKQTIHELIKRKLDEAKQTDENPTATSNDNK